jgi:hypothetical protein
MAWQLAALRATVLFFFTTMDELRLPNINLPV